MKQTAVDWLIEDLTRLGHNFKLYKKEIEQAKEIEKQYIKDAFIIGINNGVHGYKTSMEYYKKTYKK